MKQRVGEGSVWSDAIRIVGESGSAGADGTYYDYQFAVNDSLDIAPTTGWQDTPPFVGIGQYLWMRTRLVNPNTSEVYPWSVARIGGEKGEQGDSISNMGAWKTGMAVPYLGIVTMGGKTFMSKVATNNPPMWTFTDKDTNRFIFPNGGYILTGELNTDEYDLVMQHGKDGADGKKGDKGDTGEQGIQGCIIRDSEWVIGTQYRNDETLTSGTRYIDVVLVRNDSTATGWDAYKCKVTHTSTAATAPSNAAYWEKFGANITTIFTSLIIAKNAKINFLQGNQLLIQKNDGKVTAGLSGSDAGYKVRFWAGSETPDNAPFRVTEDGNAHVSGSITAGSMKYKTKTGGGSLEGYTFAMGIGTYTMPTPTDFMKVYAFRGWSMNPYPEMKLVGNNATFVVKDSNYVQGVRFDESFTVFGRVLYEFICIPDGESYYWIVAEKEIS